MKKTLSEHRLREALSELEEGLRERGFTITDAEKVLDLSKRSVSIILSELVHEGSISRTGRGTYSFTKKPPLWFRLKRSQTTAKIFTAP